MKAKFLAVALGLALVSSVSATPSSAKSVDEAKACLAQYGTYVHPDNYAAVRDECVGYLTRLDDRSAYRMVGTHVHQVAGECRSSYGEIVSSSSFGAVSAACRSFYFPVLGKKSLRIQMPST